MPQICGFKKVSHMGWFFMPDRFRDWHYGSSQIFLRLIYKIKLNKTFKESSLADFVQFPCAIERSLCQCYILRLT